jgi:two-component system sensor histidine kinase KdpD
MAEERRLLFALCHSAAVAFDRCRLSEDIRTAQMRAETEKLRAALLSSVSHDLRTPLASIIGATSTLSELGDAVPDAQQRELLAMVLSEAERLNRFVGNLLDMARIEYGKLQPRPSWCDVRDVIAQAVQGLNRALASRPLEVEVSDDFPLLHVDSVLLERVLENLVDNAVKYAKGDSPVRVTAHIEGGSAMLRVIDRGPGIPPGEREAVLTLAYRVREADKRSAGTGLGLHICRVLIEALGGTIELLDGPQRRGLCAQITLPLAELEEKQEAVAV